MPNTQQQSARTSPPPSNASGTATVLAPKPRPASLAERRKLRAQTEVKYAEFREGEAVAKTNSPRQRESLLGLARDAFRQALANDPANVAAARGLARVYGRLGEHQRAAKIYAEALKKFPKDAELWKDKGAYHVRRNEFPQAIECLSRAWQLKPDDRKSAQALAVCMAAAGRFADSLQVLTQLFGEAKAHLNMARVFEKLDNADRARAYLNRAFQLDPQLSRTDEGRMLIARLQPSPPSKTSTGTGGDLH